MISTGHTVRSKKPTLVCTIASIVIRPGPLCHGHPAAGCALTATFTVEIPRLMIVSFIVSLPFSLELVYFPKRVNMNCSAFIPLQNDTTFTHVRHARKAFWSI